MQFYKNLKRARVRMGKSQIEVAKAVGISNAALSNYETGYREPDLDTLCALSRYYGLTLDELLDVNGEQHEPIYDLSPVLKNKYIAYKGEVFELKDSQKRALLRELDNLFTKFEKSKVEDKDSKPKTYKHGNPHINRAGLASSAGSLAARPSSRLKVIRPSIISPTFNFLVISERCKKAIQRSGVIKNAPSLVKL